MRKSIQASATDSGQVSRVSSREVALLQPRRTAACSGSKIIHIFSPNVRVFLLKIWYMTSIHAAPALVAPPSRPGARPTARQGAARPPTAASHAFPRVDRRRDRDRTPTDGPTYQYRHPWGRWPRVRASGNGQRPCRPNPGASVMQCLPPSTGSPMRAPRVHQVL